MTPCASETHLEYQHGITLEIKVYLSQLLASDINYPPSHELPRALAVQQ